MFCKSALLPTAYTDNNFRDYQHEKYYQNPKCHYFDTCHEIDRL